MNNENLIHVKVNSEEAIELKKEILASEISLLKMMRYLKLFHTLRSQEFNLKETLNQQTKNVKLEINHIKRIFPKIKISPMIKKEEKAEIKKQTQKTKASQEKTIEEELAEIQGRLNRL